jgi:hypothetical protein
MEVKIGFEASESKIVAIRWICCTYQRMVLSDWIRADVHPYVSFIHEIIAPGEKLIKHENRAQRISLDYQVWKRTLCATRIFSLGGRGGGRRKLSYKDYFYWLPCSIQDIRAIRLIQFQFLVLIFHTLEADAWLAPQPIAHAYGKRYW